MKKLILNNWPLKLLALVIAFAIWIVIVKVTDPVITQTFEIPVEFTNQQVIEERNMVVSETKDLTVKIKVKKERSIVSALTIADFKAVADYSQMYRDTQVPVSVESLNGKIESNDIEQIAYSVEVKLEELKTITKAIEPETTGKTETGFAVGEIKLDETSIDITCPESLTDAISRVKAIVNVDKLTADSTISAEIALYDKNGQRIDTKKNNITIASEGIVKCDVQILNVQVAPIVVSVSDEEKIASGHKLAGIEVQPESVTIAGTKEMLAELSQIKVTDISVAGLDKTTEKEIDIRPYLPDGVILQDSSSIIVVTLKVE